MKVLISAYACEPHEGSEPGAGWSWVRAAALRNEVWLITRANNRKAVEAGLALEPDLAITPIYLDLPRSLRFWKRGQRGIHAYYLLWQALAAREAKRLHREVNFDVGHHVTFAVDWMPAGIAWVPGLPVIWGPVGGSTNMPWSLCRWVGARGAAREALRESISRPMRVIAGHATARRAALLIAQNSDVAKRFDGFSPLIIEPNVALDAAPFDTSARVPGAPDSRRAVFSGRLISLKGVALGLAALRRPELMHWSLDIYGDGPERRRLEALARRWGLSERVTFCGKRPRDEVIKAASTADAYLFPSLHDSAPWSVGEALAVGCPVVCLDRGGAPALLREYGGIAVPAQGDVPRRLANGLATVATWPRRRVDWSIDRLPDLLDIWYQQVALRGVTT